MLKILTYTKIVLVISVMTLLAGFFRIQDSLQIRTRIILIGHPHLIMLWRTLSCWFGLVSTIPD